MEIQYQMAEAEALQGILKIRRHVSRYRWLRFGATVVTTSILTLFLLSPWRYTDTVFWFACLLACVIGVAVVFLYRWYYRGILVKHVHNNAAIYTAPYTVSYDETKLTFSSPTAKQENAWLVYTHRFVDDQFICLFSRLSGALAVIPMRAFDDASLAEFLRCSKSLPQP